MRGNRRNQGFTLTEMLVVIAIIAVLAVIICLFLSRNLNRARAAVNSTNLRATRSILAMELLANPENPEEVMAQVLATAPKSEGVDVPGLSIPEGTPMDGTITEDGVDTSYGDYGEEDFEDVYEDGFLEEDTTRETAPEVPPVKLCGVLACFSTELVDGQYCAAHQIKLCEKSKLEGDQLVTCGMEYRDQCHEDHYMLVTCPCTSNGSKNKPCSNCKHNHYGVACTEKVLLPDNI